MKQLHRPDLYGWSRFNETRNLDFHSVLWVRSGGNVVIDPLDLTEHDTAHLQRLGGVALIIITNSDHIRDTERLARRTGARVAGPDGEQGHFPIHCDLWLSQGDHPVPGLGVLELEGSKTTRELALLLEKTTLIVGDLIRGQRAGSLSLLPDPMLSDPDVAVRSVKRLLQFKQIETVLTGDGWPIFRDGRRALMELVEARSG